MLDILRPDGALNVHQNPGFWTLQLNHHYGTEVASLVPVRVVVAGESSERGVRHLKVKNISFYLNSGYLPRFKMKTFQIEIFKQHL